MWHTLGQIWTIGFIGTWIFIWGALAWALMTGEKMDNKLGSFAIGVALSVIWPFTLPSLGRYMIKREKEDKEQNEKA